jgi:4'-phosphopantetheinyl transferase
MVSEPICTWSPAPDNLILPLDEVHVWCADLDRPPAEVARCRSVLSQDELSQASRFRFEYHRKQFVVRHGLLRIILGYYLEIEPEKLRFDYSEYGKPALKFETGDQELCFNLSDAAGLALYAFTMGREIGVDVEHVRSDIEHEEIAERFFSQNERMALRAYPPEDRPQAFFTCWTRKEAFIKAHGEGLSLPLDQFDVSVGVGEPAKLLATRGDLEGAERWALQHLDPAPGFVAALAVEGHGWRTRCWKVGGL